MERKDRSNREGLVRALVRVGRIRNVAARAEFTQPERRLVDERNEP